MDIIALTVFFVLRLVLPVGLLIAFGEWVRHREAKYWLHR